MSRIVQTAGRDALSDFAPQFAHFNDDVLFGENWNNEDLELKTRCLLTVGTLIASGITDSSLLHHMENAKRNGVSRREIAAAITHIAFYAGWPKAWAAFRLAREVWAGEAPDGMEESMAAHQRRTVFPIGAPNEAYARYFSGRSFLAPVSREQVPVFQVTFEPGCRNHWHIHHAAEGGGQMLICVAGEGYYQQWGQPARRLKPGDCVNIPAGVKHWHGAGKEGWFSHLALEVPGRESRVEWLEPLTQPQYEQAIGGVEDAAGSAI